MREHSTPSPHIARDVVDAEKHSGCGMCASCIYGAVRMEDKLPRIDLEACERCGACVTLCQTEALSIVPAG